jgi:uncharacterized protein GlcG (DUF336 family)
MRKTCLTLSAILLTAGLSAAQAQEDDALVTFQVLAPDLAAELAANTMQACREEGFQVTAAVVDRFGVTQALVRDRFAGPHTPETATRKAWTAISFRSSTVDLIEPTASGTPQAGARNIENVLMLGGGVLVEVAGQIVGAVGVSGAPSGADDDACARAGIDSIQDRLPL